MHVYVSTLIVNLGLCVLTLKGKKWTVSSFLSDIQDGSEIKSHCNKFNLKYILKAEVIAKSNTLKEDMMKCVQK